MVSKRQKKVLIGTAAIAAFLFFISKKSKAMDTTENTNATGSAPTPAELRAALKFILDRYGRETAKKVEQLYRWETRHFESRQYKKTFSPGMEPSPQTNTVFPFGWTSLKIYAQQNNIPASAFYLAGPFTEGGTGRQKKFVGFPNVKTAMDFLVFMINRRGGNWGKWFSLDASAAANYVRNLNAVRPVIVNSL